MGVYNIVTVLARPSSPNEENPAQIIKTLCCDQTQSRSVFTAHADGVLAGETSCSHCSGERNISQNEMFNTGL